MKSIVLAAAVLAASGLQAAEIVLPSAALERSGMVTAVYRTNGQATGKGTLSIKWTDALGRVVEDRKIDALLTDELEVRFTLDMRRAVAMANELSVHFSFEGKDLKGAVDRREEDATAKFVAMPEDPKWRDYAIIMWQNYSAAGFEKLKTLGINGGQYSGRAAAPPPFLLSNDLRWYAENIATDFYAEYHRFRRDRQPQWSWVQAKELYAKDPTNKEAFKRKPSLSDPVWLKTIHDRLVESAKRNAPYRPYFYDLADESGVADLAAFWDFDYSDHSLSAMRGWLKERYGTLDALNRQWGTGFTSWDLVTPETTDEAMKRPDQNWSSWADMKEWLDVSFASAIDMGVKAIRSVDPQANVGIAGAQMPGWGGYDYARLSQVLTAVEPYNIGNNIEILRSLNPGLPVVTTAFARGPWEQHRIWYELLHGARGNIIWDEDNSFVSKEGVVGERGKEAAPYYNEIRSGLGALLINSHRLAGPIAIHYSQASLRTEWMLAQQPKGTEWVKRTSATERLDSEFLRMRESYCRIIEDLGLQYNFVSYGQVEQGELIRGGYRVLILPRSSALSQAEVAAVREFAARGGLVIADGEPGRFDEHSRRLEKPMLADLFDSGQVGVRAVRFDGLGYYQLRVLGKERAMLEAMGKFIAVQGVRAAFEVLDEEGKKASGVETHVFRNGGVTLVGLLSNPQMRVDELGPPDFKSNRRFEKVRRVKVKLPEAVYAHDVRAGKGIGKTGEVDLTLDPYQPAILALTAAAPPTLRVTAPATITRGGMARVGICVDGLSEAATSVFHVSVTNAAGQEMLHYGGNVVAAGSAAEALLRPAVNDPAGVWTLRVKDLLSGQERTAAIEVR